MLGIIERERRMASEAMIRWADKKARREHKGSPTTQEIQATAFEKIGDLNFLAKGLLLQEATDTGQDNTTF